VTAYPVIFSAPMIQALKREVAEVGAGKSMTRRLLYREVKTRSIPPKAATYYEQFPPPSLSASRFGYRVELTKYDKVVPSDKLWVKEAGAFKCSAAPIYRADGEQGGWIWQSPLFMPRWASRFTLTVTMKWIERLHDVTEQDVEREGLHVHIGYHAAFASLWERIHGGGGVVVIGFTVAAHNIDHGAA
jgi:hypothetical protein